MLSPATPTLPSASQGTLCPPLFLPFRVYLRNETGGWKGSFLDAKGASVKAYGSTHLGDGPFLAFFKGMANDANINLEIVDPTAPLPATLRAQLAVQGLDDSHGCALGTSLSLWDVCVGAQDVSPELAGMVRFLPAVSCRTPAPCGWA